MEDETIISILKEYRISNADVTLKADNSVDNLIDVIEGNRVYEPCLYFINKIDAILIQELDLLDKVLHYNPISVEDK